MKKAVYKFHANCGRMGELEGILISTKEKVRVLIESKIEVYFGEVLGKHSEVYGAIEPDEMTFVSDNEDVVMLVEENGLTIGFNPFEYSSINFELDGESIEDLTVNDIIEKIINKSS